MRTAHMRDDLRCDDASWDGDAAVEHTESWRGAEDDTEPASAAGTAADGYVNAREFVAAQLPERLRSGYVGERGNNGPHRGKPPRRDRPLRGGERVHDPQSRRCGVNAISGREAMALGLPGGAECSCRGLTFGPARHSRRAGPPPSARIMPLMRPR